MPLFEHLERNGQISDKSTDIPTTQICVLLGSIKKSKGLIDIMYCFYIFEQNNVTQWSENCFVKHDKNVVVILTSNYNGGGGI